MLREGLPLAKWRQFASRRTTISDTVSVEFIAVFVVLVVVVVVVVVVVLVVVVLVVNTRCYYINSPEFCCKIPPVIRRGGYS